MYPVIEPVPLNVPEMVIAIPTINVPAGCAVQENCPAIPVIATPAKANEVWLGKFVRPRLNVKEPTLTSVVPFHW